MATLLNFMFYKHKHCYCCIIAIVFLFVNSASAQVFTDSNLPIVLISTDGGAVINKTPKVGANMKIIFRGPGQRNYVSDQNNPTYLDYNGRISINVRGSSSSNFPKKQYRVETQDAVGNNLNVPLLGLPQENDWILGAPYADKSLMRNVVAFDMARQQGHYAPRTVFCEVVLNGQFMGLYFLTERIKRDKNRVDINKLEPTQTQEPDVTGGYILKIDRFSQQQDDGFYTVIDNNRVVFEEPDFVDLAPQQLTYVQNYMNNFENAIFSADYGASYQHYRDFIDVNSAIDMVLLKEFSKDVDAYFLSTYMSKDREGKLVFQPVWDFNLSLGNANYRQGWTDSNWMLYINGATPEIFERMFVEPVFAQRMQCRWAELRANEWRLDSILNRIDNYRNYLDEAAIRNFNRWQILGIYVWPNSDGYQNRTTYQSEVNYMKTWITNRLNWMDNQIGTGICNYPQTPPLVINEIHYNPTDYGVQTSNEMEFIELKNTGTSTINVSEYTFSDGITYTFPVGTTIASGNFYVIASNADAFQSKYGFQPHGDYGGQLKNQGERLEIIDPYRQIVDSLTYNDAAPWPTEPDSLGPSLELIDEFSDNALAASWHASLQDCGTPNMENSITTFDPCSLNPATLVINEINYNSSGSLETQDWVEIYNPNSSQVELSGWRLQDEDFYYDIPNGTFIPGNGYLVLVQNSTAFSEIHPNTNNFIGNFSFNLNADGERIQLLSPEGCVVDEVDYNDAAPWPLQPDGEGATLSLVNSNSDNSLPGSWTGSPNAQGTPGAANTSSCPGSIPALVINEINYRSAASPNPRDWVEIYNPGPGSVNLAGWEFHNNTNRFVIPGGVSLPAGGYIILAQNKTTFQSVFPHISNPLGNIGFGFGDIGDRLVLYNPERCLVDEVSYSYLSPWPSGANGQGNSLSLTSPGLDNNNGNNWQDSPGNGTPGRVNSICPTLDITIPGTICTSENTSFQATSNLAGANYQWTFNNGVPASANGLTATTKWNSAGTNSISLTVTWFECQQTINKTITVEDCNATPNAVNNNYTLLEDTPNSGNVITNDSDPDGDALTVITTPVQNTSNGTLVLSANGTFTYTPFANFNGTDQFVYKLCDDGTPVKCDNATVILNVTAINDVPVVGNDNANTVEDLPVTIPILNNDFDVDGNIDPASITVNSPPANQGTVVVNGNGTLTYQPATNFNGNVTPFTYTVCDDGTPLPAICETATVTIIVGSVNDQPIAQNDSNSGNEDTNISGNVKTNDSDPDGNTLTVQTTPISQPNNGTVTLSANGNYAYTPGANFNGTDNFIYEICDGQSPQLCDQATVTLTINPINDAPVLSDDLASTSEDESITITILNNDNDIDGNFNLSSLALSNLPPASEGTVTTNPNGSITFTPALNYNGAVAPFNYTICDDGTPLPAICRTALVSITVSSENDTPVAMNDAATILEDNSATGNLLTNDQDTEGDNLTLTSSPITNPQNGTVSLLPNGDFTYTPNPNYNGNDAFIYEVCDDGVPQLCAQANVQITINAVNDSPVTLNDVASTNEDTPVTINVLANDNDVDGSFNLSTLTLNNLPPGTQGTAIVNGNGSITFTPATNYNGNVSTFNYQICDTGTPLPAKCSTADINISVSSSNDAPLAVADQGVINEDATLTGNVSQNDSDPDNNSLLVNTTPISSTTNGSLSLLANGNYTYTPNTDFSGSDAFTYEICDNGTPVLCAQAEVSITINPINDAPVANNDIVSTLEDTPFFISILGNDNDKDGNLDPASITLQNLPPANQGTISINSNGTLTFSPAVDYFGVVDVFSYTICDDGTPLPALCSNATVSVTVNSVNDAPIAQNDAATTNEDNQVAGDVLSNDSDPSDNNALSVSTNLVNGTSNGTVSINAAGQFTYTPQPNFNGTDQFEYEVCDDGTPILCTTAIVNLTINPINDTPQANDDNVTTTEDAPITFSVINNDNDIDGNIDPLTITLNNQIPAGQGQLTVNPDGTLSYVPAANFFGTVTTVSYTVCDDGAPLPAKCTNANINITVTSVNDKPVAQDDSATTTEDNLTSGNVLANDSDPIDNNNLLVSTTLIAQPSNGNVSISANGNFTYIPNSNFNGTDQFTYQVCDDGIPSACDQASVNIVVQAVNDGPVLVNDVATTNEDTPVIISILNNDNDQDGNLDVNSLSLTTSPTLPEGTINLNADGTITFTPVQDFNGTVPAITYEICDDGTPLPGLCNTATIQIEVLPINDQPTAQDDNIVTVENGTATGNLLTNDNDLDGDGLVLNSAPISSPGFGSLTLSANGSYSYQPNPGYSGPDSFEYEVCDDGSPVLCNSAIAMITVFPCPEATILANPSVCVGQTINFEAVDQGVGATYYWNFGTGASPQQATGRMIDVVYSTPTTLLVSLDVVKDGCTVSAQTSLSVNEEAFANAGNDGTICSNSSLVLGGAPTGPLGATYSWSPAIGMNSYSVPNPVASPNTTTTYTVTVSLGSCSITDQVTVVVDNISASFADAGPDQVFCGSGIQIGGAPSGPVGATYSWSPPNGLDDPSSSNPNASPVVPTTYTLTVSKNGCSVTDQVYVNKITPPTMEAGADAVICYDPNGQGAILGGPNNFPVNTYLWSPSVGLSHPTEGNTFANPAVTTTYTLTATRNGCSVIDEVTVTVNYCNDHPIAVDDQMTITMDAVLATNLLSNDTDPNGDNLELFLSPVTPPENGNVTFYPNGDILYTPGPEFTGSDSLRYEICDDGQPNYCDQAMLYIEVVPPPCTEVNLKVFLEGPYDFATENMNTTLNTVRKLLPGQIPANPLATWTPPGQPFHIAPWYYLGDEGQNFGASSYGADVVDWLLVSFRTSPQKNTEVVQLAALLLKDGTVELVDPCPLNEAIVGPLYIVIEHRYHLAVMSPNPVQIVDGKIEFDFTIQDSYGNGGYGQKLLSAGVWAMFAGDCSQVFDETGYDINGNDKIVWFYENGNFDGYNSADFNMDGDVNGSDKILYTNNNGVFSRIPK